MIFPSKKVWGGSTGSLWDKTEEGAKTLPDGYIAKAVVNAARGGGQVTEITLLVREARRRGMTGLAWAINRFDPPPCRCGKKGLYIVNDQTYCSEHRHEARSRLQRYGQTKEKLRAAYEKVLSEQDQALRAAEKHHKAKGRKAPAFK